MCSTLQKNGSSLAKFSIAIGVREFKATLLSGRLEGNFLCIASKVSDINIQSKWRRDEQAGVKIPEKGIYTALDKFSHPGFEGQ